MDDNRYDWNGFIPEDPKSNDDNKPVDEIKSESKTENTNRETPSYSDINSSYNAEPKDHPQTWQDGASTTKSSNAEQDNISSYKTSGSNYTSPTEGPDKSQSQGYNYTFPKDDYSSPQTGSNVYNSYNTPSEEQSEPQNQAYGHNYTVPKDDPMAYHPVYQSYNQPSEYTPQTRNESSYQNYAYDYNAADNTSANENYNSFGSSAEPKRKKKKSGKFGLKIAAIALVCALAGGAIGGAGTYYALSSSNSNTASRSGSTGQTVNIDESYNSSVEAVADKVIPSVVGIQATYTSNDYGYFGQSSEYTSEGTGVVYTEDGYIITNYHVISNSISSGKILVVLDEDDTEGYEATVVGYDASSDLAVLKIDATGLTPIEIGNSDDIKVGQTAIAVGNPGGLQFMNSVSAGIISGLNRTLTTESGATMNLIQTDAAINPGNSGGALVDGTGKLIGINSAKISGSTDSSSASYEGMGFAIPVNTVVEICDKLIANEGNESAYLGVQIDSRYDSSTLEAQGYPGGLVVYSVVEGSPASEAGIQANDILVSLDGTALTTFDILSSQLSQRSAGDTVTIEVYRSGQTTQLTVTLGANNA